MEYYIKIIHRNDAGEIESQSCAMDGDDVLIVKLDPISKRTEITATSEEIYRALKAYRESAE